MKKCLGITAICVGLNTSWFIMSLVCYQGISLIVIEGLCFIVSLICMVTVYSKVKVKI